MDIAGRVAIVTGAGGAMGGAIAEALGQRGAITVCADRDELRCARIAARISASGGRSVVSVFDVTDWTAVRDAVDAVVDECGRLDIVVNNAGVYSSIGALVDADPAAWRVDLDTNLFGTFAVCRAALPYLLERGEGVVVNMSGGGFGGPLPGGSAYSCSKAALIRMTETLALELGQGVPEKGVQGLESDVIVFALEPGFVAGDMNDRVVQSEAGRRWLPYVVEAIEAGQTVEPEDVGNGVCSAIEAATHAMAGLVLPYHHDFSMAPSEYEHRRAAGVNRLLVRLGPE